MALFEEYLHSDIVYGDRGCNLSSTGTFSNGIWVAENDCSRFYLCCISWN